VFPVTAASLLPPVNSPSLEYQVFLFEPGTVRVDAIVASTLNFMLRRGLRYAVAMDDQKPQVVDILANETQEKWGELVFGQAVPVTLWTQPTRTR
jgi:Gylcosyl hydrolase family 115 C-terminal domain